MEFFTEVEPQPVPQVKYNFLEQNHPYNVLLYNTPPDDNIHLEEFEELALERLKVLRIYEMANDKNLKFLSDNWKEFIQSELLKQGLKGYLYMVTHSSSGGSSKTDEDDVKHDDFELQARRKDYLSHFILRLAYCRSTDLIQWFIARELELFKHKFSVMNPAEIKNFINIYRLNYSPLSQEEKDSVKDKLIESTIGESATNVEILDFYKVPFTQVVDLVRSRRCYIKKGFAYVNIKNVVSIVALKQQELIMDGLRKAQVLIYDVDTDERISHFMKSLHNSYTGKDYTLNTNAEVPVESLDKLSKKSYPLCMRMCHDFIRSTHHIKHEGRMQYGLFLKGIGVTLKDSIRFWREEFTKNMDLERFVKDYEYNIEHNYGKKGSMVNYAPYSCLKIIKGGTTAGSMNGCPYRIYDQNALGDKLITMGLSRTHAHEIVSYAAKGHYQLACSKYFQIMHNTNAEIAINHPNQYFEESQDIQRRQSEQKLDKTIQSIVKSQNENSERTHSSNAYQDELWEMDAC